MTFLGGQPRLNRRPSVSDAHSFVRRAFGGREPWMPTTRRGGACNDFGESLPVAFGFRQRSGQSDLERMDSRVAVTDE